MKQCSMCLRRLPLAHFSLCTASVDGHFSQCKECFNERNRLRYQRDKTYYIKKATLRKEKTRQWLSEYRVAKGCQRCPEKHPACLQFHHTRKREFYLSGRGLSASRIRLLKELAKCIVLCANCHAKHHAKDKTLGKDPNYRAAGSIPAEDT